LKTEKAMFLEKAWLFLFFAAKIAACIKTPHP
jgi:hypothetical protein